MTQRLLTVKQKLVYPIDTITDFTDVATMAH